MKKYTLYWNYGRRQVIEGDTPNDALHRAGILKGELGILSLWRFGDHQGYTFQAHLRKWVDSNGTPFDYCAQPKDKTTTGLLGTLATSTHSPSATTEATTAPLRTEPQRE